MVEEILTIDPPEHLIGKMRSCWRCGAKMPVVAILAPGVQGAAGEICILSEITELPEVVLAYPGDLRKKAVYFFNRKRGEDSEDLAIINLSGFA